MSSARLTTEDIRRIRAEARARTAERRRRLLAHPDIAQRLTERPLCFPRPGMWNGYVPPASGFWGRVSRPGELPVEVPNNSPAYFAFCELGRAVAERERTEQ